MRQIKKVHGLNFIWFLLRWSYTRLPWFVGEIKEIEIYFSLTVKPKHTFITPLKVLKLALRMYFSPPPLLRHHKLPAWNLLVYCTVRIFQKCMIVRERIMDDDSGLARLCNAKDYGEHTRDQEMFRKAQGAVGLFSVRIAGQQLINSAFPCCTLKMQENYIHTFPQNKSSSTCT